MAKKTIEGKGAHVGEGRWAARMFSFLGLTSSSEQQVVVYTKAHCRQRLSGRFLISQKQKAQKNCREFKTKLSAS